ncbi:unnamed protein product [Paramecium sonneborni]|uniref:MORN repeat protein n=1 Tax=Paramecium sonneborni TaxID=65129 RepID=A0A8S1KXZ6_9CILI|nr:unnamed protein product [Paramecium sonneborni]
MGNRCIQHQQLGGEVININDPINPKNEEPQQLAAVVEIKPPSYIVDPELQRQNEERSAIAIQGGFKNKMARQEANKQRKMLEEDKPIDWTVFEGQFQIPNLPDVAYNKINKQISNDYRMLPAYIKDGDIYLGQWQKRQFQGYGQLLKSDGTYLEGQWKNGQLDDGAIYFPNKDLYLGQQQIGVRIYNNGVQYSGDCSNRLPHGQGIEEHPDGTKYQGQFINGQKHGKGLMLFADGSEYNGEYKHGQMEGNGVFKWPNGFKYDGQWQRSMMNGRGRLYFYDGTIYEGGFHDDIIQGQGIMTYTDGSKFEGHFQNNKRVGKGFVTTCDRVVTECDWENGELMINPIKSQG